MQRIRTHKTMITKILVQPSYKSIRLMDFLNCIPVALETKSGRLYYEDKLITKAVHYTLFYLGILKTLHVSYALTGVIIRYKPEDFPIVILTALWLSLFSTSMYWGSELFHRGLQETIILFNSLEYAAPALTTKPRTGTSTRRQRAIANIKQFTSSLRPVLINLNLQELMCILTPFTIKMFPLVYYLLMAVFPHWTIFTTSLIHTSEEADWTWMSGLFVVFEILTSFYMESNILFLFFFQLALQATQLAQLVLEVDTMR